MGIRKWKDHGSKTRIYLSKQWPDGTRFRRLMPNRTVAKKTFARIEESIAMGTWRNLRVQLGAHGGQANPTIADLAPDYLQHCEAINRRPDFKTVVVNQIVAVLGNIRISDFSPVHAHRFIAERSREVQPATVNRGLAVLKHLLRFAVERGLITLHPLYGFRMLPEEATPLRIMTVEEFRSLVQSVTAQDSVIGAFTALLGETGLRKSEGLQLKHCDVNLTEGRLTVARSKSGLPRYVPLSQYAVEWLQLVPRVLSCSHVFVRMETMKPWRDPRGPFRSGRDEAGLTWVKGFHDLRHFRATQWLANGVDLKTVSELLGHTDLATTQRYVHFLSEHATQEVRKAQARELRLIGTGRKLDGAKAS